MSPNLWQNNSGGAEGSDLAWDKIGREYGFNNHKHWRPKDLLSLSEEQRGNMVRDVTNAALVLHRPTQFKGIELVQRNWLQVIYSTAVYALGYVITPNGYDYKGFKNVSGKDIVSGGTGWAIEMAIQKGYPVWVFDMHINTWGFWSYVDKAFLFDGNTPSLDFKYAGIGSRNVNPDGIQAIRDVYVRTIKLNNLITT